MWPRHCCTRVIFVFFAVVILASTETIADGDCQWGLRMEGPRDYAPAARNRQQQALVQSQIAVTKRGKSEKASMNSTSLTQANLATAAVNDSAVPREVDRGNSSATKAPKRLFTIPDRVLWPPLHKLPPVLRGRDYHSTCILDGFVWSLILCIIMFTIVYIGGRCVGYGAPSGPDADDKCSYPNSNDEDEDDDEDSPGIPADVYARFTLRKRCWLLIRRPESGPGALALSVFLNNIILLSLISMTVQSIHTVKKTLPGLFDLSEWVFLIVFTVEWMWMQYYSSSFMRQLQNPMTYMDFLAVFPSYIDVVFRTECVWQGSHAEVLYLLRLLRLLRILRLAKLLVRSKRIEIVRKAIIEAAPALCIAVSILATAVFVPAVLMFHAEQGQWSEKDGCHRRVLAHGELEEGCSPFEDIPSAMYWAVTTVTTVGYGDVTPVSKAGRVVSGISMILGVLAIAVPISVVSNSYHSVMENMKAEEALRNQEALRKEQVHHQ